MARFVMSHRRAGKSSESEKVASRGSMSDVLSGSFMTGSSIVARNEPRDDTARHLVLFEAEPAEVDRKSASLPGDVIVEKEIHHHLGPFLPLEPPGAASAETAATPGQQGATTELAVTVRSHPAGEPLQAAEVNLFFRGYGFDKKVSAVTDAQGRAVLRFAADLEPSAVAAMPLCGYWPMVVPAPGADAIVACAPLPDAAAHLGWWHDRVGVSSYQDDRGSGIGVGVIDTGVGPHPALAHVRNAGAFIDGEVDLDGSDVQSHGTHICGIIGARPTAPRDFGGIAPGASLYSARIFPPEGTATQLGIAHAIDELSRHDNVDLINMSLGSDEGSQILRDAIIHALERGTLCICAAGNTAGDVMYPAAFSETVAVTALGLVGWGPPGSVPEMRAPPDRSRFGDDDLFLDVLSCHGAGVASTAPGVGIISTVPERLGSKAPYAAMGGTSMAASIVCGTLAVLLSRSPEYSVLPRTRVRAEQARKILGQSCRSVGLDAALQGMGVPVS